VLEPAEGLKTSLLSRASFFNRIQENFQSVWKLQGMVTLRVLVGVDGRVKDVQITRRLGLGLDENAVQAVRSWQFIPAKEAARRPVASWITIETLFRLY
jgi:TonB family protein